MSDAIDRWRCLAKKVRASVLQYLRSAHPADPLHIAADALEALAKPAEGSPIAQLQTAAQELCDKPPSERVPRLREKPPDTIDCGDGWVMEDVTSEWLGGDAMEAARHIVDGWRGTTDSLASDIARAIEQREQAAREQERERIRLALAEEAERRDVDDPCAAGIGSAAYMIDRGDV